MDNTARTFVIPEGTTIIEDSSFRCQCEELQKAQHIVIPNSVTTIGDYAFAECAFLQDISIPNSVTRIGIGAFWECKSLQSIHIPNSVTTIGDGAFDRCANLQRISVESGNRVFCDIDGVLFNKEKTQIIRVPSNKAILSDFIPSSVATIESWAFWECKSIQSIHIPNSVTTIGDGAFDGCANLQRISVESGNQVFCDIDGVLFNKEKTQIIRVPSNKAILCYSIPNSVTTIGSGAFDECLNLQSIHVPSFVTAIEEAAFDGCANLQRISVESGNRVFCDIDGVLFNKEKTQIIRVPSNKAIHCYSIPNSVTTIGSGAFHDCLNLQSIHIPSSVTTIGEWAFGECKALQCITIPDSVKSIGNYAFCMSPLLSIRCNSRAPEKIELDKCIFDDSTFSSATLYVPTEAIQAYREHPMFGWFEKIETFHPG